MATFTDVEIDEIEEALAYYIDDIALSSDIIHGFSDEGKREDVARLLKNIAQDLKDHLPAAIERGI